MCFNVLLRCSMDGRFTDGQGPHGGFHQPRLLILNQQHGQCLDSGSGRFDPARHGETGEKKRVNEAPAAPHFRPEFLNRLDESIIFPQPARPMNCGPDRCAAGVERTARSAARRAQAWALECKHRSTRDWIALPPDMNPVYGARPL